MVIGIIGQGFVGSAIFSKFSKYFKVLTYDLEPNLCNSNLSQIKNECQVVFTCLPTPMKKNGDCDISIVESVIKDLNDVKKLIVVNKSTVVPGTTEFLNNKYQNIQIVFNPEFLTERNAKKDLKIKIELFWEDQGQLQLLLKIFTLKHVLKFLLLKQDLNTLKWLNILLIHF